MVLATLLQIPSARKPLRWLSRNAPRVSAVSPLWLMANTSVSSVIGVLRCRNSLAKSTSVEILADSAGMQRSSATGENDALDFAQLWRRHVEATQPCRGLLVAETAAHRV